MQYVARVANSINVGRAGEFLVAAELEQRGIRCHRVDMQDDDLWVKSASGALLTMQVKATLEPRKERYREAHYVFTRANGDAQIFAYVALSLRLFILRTAPIGKTVRIKPADFTRQAMNDSIEAMLG
jgi:hypothetical protein